MAIERKTVEQLLSTVGPEMTVLEFARDVFPEEGDGDGKDTKQVSIIFGQRPFPPDPRERAESPPAAHVFNDIDGFIRYLEVFANSDATIVLASVKSECIAATLDECSEDGRQVVTFKPEPHPLILPWLAILNRQIDIKGFAQFLMQRRRAVVEPDGRELALMLSQVRAEWTFTLHAGVGKNALNGLLVKTRIDGEVKSLPVELPETLVINVPLYLNTAPERIELDLLITSPKPDEVVVTVSAADLEERRLRVFFDMLEMVKSRIGTAIAGLGTLEYGEWEYLR